MVVGDTIFIPINVFNNLDVTLEAPVSVEVNEDAFSWVSTMEVSNV